MIKVESSRAAESDTRWLATIVFASALVAVLEGIFVALEWTGESYDVAATLITVVTLLLAWRCLAKHNGLILTALLLLVSVQFGLFVFKLVGTDHPMSPRLLQVAIAVLYGATVLSALLVGARMLTAFKAVALSFSLGMGIFL